MFQKFIHIKRLGKFNNYNANGDCAFRNFNLVYAENGMGKTTLTSILRSMKENSPNLLLQRKNVNETEAPNITLRAFENNYVFNGINWVSTFSDIEIFDSYFINQNVFSGDIVQLENKRNLYHLVIGAQGVELANEVNRLDGEIRQSTQRIHYYTDQIKNNIISNYDFNSFLGLENEEEYEESLREKEIELEIAKNADSILRQSNLLNIILPEINIESISDILEYSIDTISKKTEQKVKDHISIHLGEGGEDWIQKGLSFPESADCPFCNQNIQGNELINLYKDYFSEGYKEFKNELTNRQDELLSSMSSNVINQIKPSYERNNLLKIFWEKYFEINIPEIDVDNSKERISNLIVLITQCFENKNANPLEIYELPQSIIDALTDYSEIQNQINDYNRIIDGINQTILEKKNESMSINKAIVENELIRLRNIPIRYSEAVNTFCVDYLNELQQKELLETQKAEVKRRLDEETEEIFANYQREINVFLERFNVNFRIANTARNYLGGKPSVKYFISLDTHNFDPSNVSQNDICFQSALSDGDKSSLAFAFFLARLRLETNLANKIIVFDDPINSLGDHRRSCTVQEIIRVSPLCLQTIVLSHDAYFLRELYEKIPPITPQYKLFKIQRSENGVNLIPDWNIERETSGKYFENYSTLVDYLAGIQTDNLRMVAMCIRPLLEGNLRLRFPTQFPREEWLGSFIGRIRDANDGDPLFILNGLYNELDAINDYSQNFHHDRNLNADTQDINDTELQGFVRRTLNILPGILSAG